MEGRRTTHTHSLHIYLQPLPSPGAVVAVAAAATTTRVIRMYYVAGILCYATLQAAAAAAAVQGQRSLRVALSGKINPGSLRQRHSDPHYIHRKEKRAYHSTSICIIMCAAGPPSAEPKPNVVWHFRRIAEQKTNLLIYSFELRVFFKIVGWFTRFKSEFSSL